MNTSKDNKEQQNVKKSLVIIAIVILQAVGLIGVFKFIMKPPVKVQNMDPVHSISAPKMYAEFLEDKFKFNQKYLNKVIHITGVVTSIEDSIIILNDKMYCIANAKLTGDVINQTISLKGRYIGYDDLFDNLKINECILESL